MAELVDRLRDLQRVMDNTEPLQHAVGQFAKKEALERVKHDLGGDMGFSGWRSRVKLGAGYDTGNPVVLNMRPAGMWFLADEGRKRRKKILPKTRGKKKAVVTPRGIRRYSNSTPSKGHKTYTKTIEQIDKGIVKAAEEGLNDMLTKGGFY